MSRPRSPNSKLTPRCTTVANKYVCLFHRLVALTLPVSVNIDIKGEGGSPTLTASRMSVYFTDTGILICVPSVVCEQTLILLVVNVGSIFDFACVLGHAANILHVQIRYPTLTSTCFGLFLSSLSVLDVPKLF